MIRKYHILTLQTNPWHHEERLQNTNRHNISERQLKKSNQLSCPRQDDCKGYKVMHNKTRIKHNSPPDNGRNIKQWINNNRTTTLDRTATQATEGVNAIYHPKFSCCYNTKKYLAHMEASKLMQCICTGNRIKLTHTNEIKKQTRKSQIVLLYKDLVFCFFAPEKQYSVTV